MAQLRDKDYEEFKKISDKEGIKYESDLEMKQSADNLVGLVEILLKIDLEERSRKRLRLSPKAFRWLAVAVTAPYAVKVYTKLMVGTINEVVQMHKLPKKTVDKKIIPDSICGD